MLAMQSLAIAKTIAITSKHTAMIEYHKNSESQLSYTIEYRGLKAWLTYVFEGDELIVDSMFCSSYHAALEFIDTTIEQYRQIYG